MVGVRDGEVPGGAPPAGQQVETEGAFVYVTPQEPTPPRSYRGPLGAIVSGGNFLPIANSPPESYRRV